MKITEDSHYIISYYRDKTGCYHTGEVCNSGSNNVSKIAYFDQDYNELWSLGGNRIDEIEMLYDNHQYTSYAIAQLNDGRFVSLGQATDLESNILYDAYIIIDQTGEITEMQYLDYYQYLEQSKINHHRFEIVQTKDGGFTVKYSIDYDTVLIHYNSEVEEEWHYLITDYDLRKNKEYLETLNYVDDTYYVLTNNTITSLSSDGIESWNKTFDFTVTSINVTDGDLILSGQEDNYIIYPETSFKIGDSVLPITSFKTIHIDSSGNIICETEHKSLNKRNIDFVSRYAFTDESGNIYNLLIDYLFYPDNRDYHMYLLKFSEKGDFIGSETLEGTYNTFFNTSSNRSFYFVNYTFEDDILEIFTPTTSIHREINIDSLDFEHPMLVDFNLTIHNIIIIARVYLNNISGGLIIGYLLYLSYFFYTRDSSQDDNPFI
jgi:hypothetical protein